VGNNSLCNIITGNNTERETSTTSKQEAPVTTNASSAVGGDKQKVLVERSTRATLPRGVSGNWYRQANSRCIKRKLMLFYVYFISRLLVGDILWQWCLICTGLLSSSRWILRAVVIRIVKLYDTVFMVKDLWLQVCRVFTGDTGCRAIFYPGGLGRDRKSKLYYVLHGVLVL